MESLLSSIRKCNVCQSHLPYSCRPIVQASELSRIVIIGQAPGEKVQQSGVPWDDRSGQELRRWLGVTDDQFYYAELFALVPMGFCYPGRGKSGDAPPRPECAPLWHDKILAGMPGVKLIILIGMYAQQYYLRDRSYKTLTENVRAYKDFLPDYLPLVHPSPRNRIWQKKNSWFETDVVPMIQEIVWQIIGNNTLLMV